MADLESKAQTETRRRGLKTRPLRLPGQSNEEHISKLRDDFTDVLLLPAIWVVVAMAEWWRWWFAAPPSPWVPSVLTVLTALYAYWRYHTIRLEIQNYQLGRDGERLVGEMLEQLRAKGYQVFHDMPAEGRNIDHVIVGPAGVFTIETKTRSKPTRGGSSIVFDGETVRIGNGTPTNEHLNQAWGQARWLADMLNDGRSSKLIVRPVVVFPEWYVERIADWRRGGLWVLNPKELDDFLDCELEILTVEKIDSVANILARHCRQLAA
jgi:hypothetical protein